MDGFADNGSDIDSDNAVKRARVEDCNTLVSASVEPGVIGNGEINALAMSEQQGASSLPLQAGQRGYVPQTWEDIDSGRDEGVKGSDSLIHTKMFPGEASLIHPNVLLEFGYSGRAAEGKERGGQWPG